MDSHPVWLQSNVEARLHNPISHWYVVFTESSLSWLKWLKPGFRHCLAYAHDEVADRWIIFDMRFDGCYLRTFTDEQLGRAVGYWKLSGAKILLAEVDRSGSSRAPGLLVTCVGAIKGLLGIGGSCALTPWALYQTLLRRGAIPIGE